MDFSLQSLIAMDPAQLLTLLSICSARTLVAFALLPMFAAGMVPNMARFAIALSIVFPITLGHLKSPLPVDINTLPLIIFLGREAAIGLIIGLGFGAFFAGLQTVGEIIDHQTGLTFTQNIDPVHGNSVSLTAKLLERVLFAALMTGGVMLAIIDTLYLSYEVWPLGQGTPTFERMIPLSLVTHASKLFALSLLLAGPVLLVMFVIDVGIGLLNRASPQLSVFNITLSLKSIVGLAVLMMALPMIVERIVFAMGEITHTLQLFIMEGH